MIKVCVKKQVFDSEMSFHEEVTSIEEAKEKAIEFHKKLKEIKKEMEGTSDKKHV